MTHKRRFADAPLFEENQLKLLFFDSVNFL